MTVQHEADLVHYGYGIAVEMCLHDALSTREMEILSYIAQGYENKAIGQLLGIHERTVRSHCISLFDKLGVSNRTHAVRIAYQRGYLSPVQPQDAQAALRLAAHYTALAQQMLGEMRHETHA